VTLTLFSILATSALHSPAQPTPGQRLVNALLGFGIGVGLIVFFTTAYAVAVAPHQQRNELRRRVRSIERQFATASPAHIERLRAVTQHLGEEVRGHGRPLLYTDGTHFGPTLRAIWRNHAVTESALLDEYEAAEPRAQEAREAVNPVIAAAAAGLDPSEGWDQRNMANALRRLVDASVNGGKKDAAFRVETTEIPAAERSSGAAQRLVLVFVGNQNFVIWVSKGDEDFPLLEAPRKALNDVFDSVPLARAKLERLVIPSTEHRAWGALEQILGRDGYFPGDCSDLCRSPEDTA